MKYIFDFDDVLFNTTKQLKEHMFRLIAEAGVPETEARAYYLEVRQKEFSLKKFIAILFGRDERRKGINQNTLYEAIMTECSNFKNTELIEAIQRIPKDDRYIVTNGEDEFNRDKLKYSGIGELFHKSHIYIVPGSKQEAIKEICDKNKGEKIVFVDDKKRFIDELLYLKRDYPNLTTILYDEYGYTQLMAEINQETTLELKRAGIR